ncbi:MAG: methyl-viologen-reducing hydrogenase subunit delta [Lentisphaerae bacterium RIFOXYB12_FULL_65_16]|nr:MAG: methyl-viologen-reducing hydrogenase subunit delta [Lentisphaerae bacterium RIFOXYA12_64_32]OGV93575.1 MAG: methyl-viologen-reducing hydrogenase subunit delta [Lentisphaerae bacterium RIFOXYB12_FULL_65_16]
MAEFEPKIVAFVCNWCSYAGADKAGGQKLAYAAQVKLVRVMCSGRVDPLFVMDAFRQGADGVMVLGCHPGDCHYRAGNKKAQQRFRILSRMLPQFGIESDRFRLDWVAAGEAERFQTIANEMTDRVRALGPLRIRGYVAKEVA